MMIKFVIIFIVVIVLKEKKNVEVMNWILLIIIVIIGICYIKILGKSFCLDSLLYDFECSL